MRDTPTELLAWLIERGEAPWIEYWGGEHIDMWTKDAYKAVWFPTELAAHTIAAELRIWIGGSYGTRIVQHGFITDKKIVDSK